MWNICVGSLLLLPQTFSLLIISMSGHRSPSPPSGTWCLTRNLQTPRFRHAKSIKHNKGTFVCLKKAHSKFKSHQWNVRWNSTGFKIDFEKRSKKLHFNFPNSRGRGGQPNLNDFQKFIQLAFPQWRWFYISAPSSSYLPSLRHSHHHSADKCFFKSLVQW